MILHWTNREKDLRLQWIGPNTITHKLFSTTQEVESKMAVIMGPRGRDGIDGKDASVPLPQPEPVVQPDYLEGGIISDDSQVVTPADMDGGFF